MKKALSLILVLILVMSFATASFALTSVPVKSIKLSNTTLVLEVGKTQQLSVTITPSNASGTKIAYSSSDKNVALVSTNGKITAMKAGKAVITATSTSNKKAVATCNVTVVASVAINLKGGNITLMGGPPQKGEPKYDAMMARIADLQKKYNFTFKYVSMDQTEMMAKVPASIMAGQPVADILAMNFHLVYPGLVNKGFVVPLENLFDFSNPKWSKAATKYSTFDGKVYGMYASSKFYPQRMMFFNKTLFAKAGIPNPYALQKNMQWTWDKMTEYAIKLTKDTNGDGQTDQWGVTGMQMELSAIYSNGGRDVKIVNGKPVVGLADPEAIEAMDWLQKLAMVNKCLYVTKPNDAWNVGTTLFQDGKAAMYIYAYWVVDGFKQNMKDDYGLISFPMGPKAKNYVTYVDAGGYGINCIPKGVKNLKEKAFIYDKLTDPYPVDLQNPNQWKIDYGTALRDKESLDTLNMMWNTNDINFGMIACFGQAGTLEAQAGYDLLHSQKTASQIMGASKGAIQAAINDVIAQK